MKKMYTEKLVIGERIVDEPFCLKSLRKEIDGSYSAIVSDRTGEIPGIISIERFSESFHELVGSAVAVTAVIVDGINMQPTLRIKTMRSCGKEEFSQSELFIGLTAEKRNEYIAMIRKNIAYVQHEGYRRILDCALSDQALKRLGELPATLSKYGKYGGGALAATAMVSSFCVQIGGTYCRHVNGLYTGTINWSLLLTGSLLAYYGNLQYFTDMPWKKTLEGVNLGYASMLQISVLEVIQANHIAITKLEVSNLFNILQAAMAGRTEVRSTCKEGAILRHAVSAYHDIDMIDAVLADFCEGDNDGLGYIYNDKLHYYVAHSNKEARDDYYSYL